MPSFAPSVTPLVNCSEYQETFQVPDLPITINYVVNKGKFGGEGTFSAQVVYAGIGWLGFGLSPYGGMNGSSVVIGSAQSSINNVAVNPGKYFLGGPSESFITPIERQSLLKKSIVQNSTHTILTFTKLLEEEGEPSINGNGTNTFVVAHGFTNTFGYHEGRASFQLSLSHCVSNIEEEFDHRVFVNATSNYTATRNETEDLFTVGVAAPVEALPSETNPYEALSKYQHNGGNLMTGRAAGPNNNRYPPADAFAESQQFDDWNPSRGNPLFSTSAAVLCLALCLFM